MDPVRISHYELRRLLGRGGMGEVHEAFDLKARRAVALKFVAPELASDAAAFRRFETEALHAAAMNHPHIATLYEFEPDGPRPFIAMELVGGPSLRQRIDEGPMPVREALETARDVAAALAYAHRRGIVHRDIKPENLMFDEEGRIKVMDFGLARALLASRLTVTGTSLGTPSYMSPEAVHQGSGSAPADVFALGLVLVEMLTGRQVFRGDSPLAVMYAIANVEPPPLRGERPDAPAAAEDLVRRMLDKDPERRADAASVARELAELTGVRFATLSLEPGEAAAGAATPAGALTPAPAATAGATPAPAGTAGPAPAHAAEPGPAASPRAPARRGRALTLAAAAVVLIGAAAVWLAVSSADRRARREEAVVLNNRSHAALQRGDLAEAHALVAQALERDPGFGEALFNRAALYDRAGDLDSAAALYGALARSHARDTRLVAMVLYNLGDIDLRTGAPDQAAEHLGRSFALDSSKWEVYNNLGYALVQAGRPLEASALLERGLTRFPGAAPLHKNAALALVALDREADALDRLDRALARDPRLVSARALRARVRARLGRASEALADWRLYVASQPPPDAAEVAVVERELIERGVLP